MAFAGLALALFMDPIPTSPLVALIEPNCPQLISSQENREFSTCFEGLGFWGGLNMRINQSQVSACRSMGLGCCLKLSSETLLMKI